MSVVVVDVGQKDLFEVAAVEDQEPIEALAADAADPAFDDARQQPSKRYENDPISRPAVRPSNLPAKHRQLVPQNDNLDFVRGFRPATQHDQSEQVPKQPVQT